MRSTIIAACAAATLGVGQSEAWAQELSPISVPTVAMPTSQARSTPIAFVSDEPDAHELQIRQFFPLEAPASVRRCTLPCQLRLDDNGAYQLTLADRSGQRRTEWSWVVPGRGETFALRHEPSMGARSALIATGGTLSILGGFAGGGVGLVAMFVGLACAIGRSGCDTAATMGLIALGGVAVLTAGIIMIVVGSNIRPRERVTLIDSSGESAQRASLRLPMPQIAQVPAFSLTF